MSDALVKERYAIQVQCKGLESKGLIKSEKSIEGRKRRFYFLTLLGLLETLRRETREPGLWIQEVAKAYSDLLPSIFSSTIFEKYPNNVGLALRFVARELTLSSDRITDESVLRSSVYYRFVHLILAPKLKKPPFSDMAGFQEAVSEDPIAADWYGTETGWILLYLTQFLHRSQNLIEISKLMSGKAWFRNLPEEEKNFINILSKSLGETPESIRALPNSSGGILRGATIRNLREHRTFIILFIICLSLRLFWLDQPIGNLIFDEVFYVNAARVILGIQQHPLIFGEHKPPSFIQIVEGLDPNIEHPPLAKLIITTSIWLVGDNGWGWRLPSVIFGSASILLFYLLLRQLTQKKMAPIVGSFLFGFDNLIFVHSRIATLDIFMLAFMLLGFYLFFKEKPILSGVALALSALCKEVGAFGVAVLIGYTILRIIKNQYGRMQQTKKLCYLILSFIASGVALLAVMDWLWVGFLNPFNHIAAMIHYSTLISREILRGSESYPWQWLINEVKMPYLWMNYWRIGSELYSISFTGAMNPVILFAAIPSIVYLTYRRGEASLFLLSWFFLMYTPFLLMQLLWHRISYIFYFLPIMPAVCAMVSNMITDENIPRIVVIGYLVVVLAGFIYLFPFKPFWG